MYIVREISNTSIRRDFFHIASLVRMSCRQLSQTFGSIFKTRKQENYNNQSLFVPIL